MWSVDSPPCSLLLFRLLTFLKISPHFLSELFTRQKFPSVMLAMSISAVTQNHVLLCQFHHCFVAVWFIQKRVPKTDNDEAECDTILPAHSRQCASNSRGSEHSVISRSLHLRLSVTSPHFPSSLASPQVSTRARYSRAPIGACWEKLSLTPASEMDKVLREGLFVFLYCKVRPIKWTFILLVRWFLSGKRSEVVIVLFLVFDGLRVYINQLDIIYVLSDTKVNGEEEKKERKKIRKKNKKKSRGRTEGNS